MIIAPSRNYIFVHIHKCAGQSIEKACAPYLSGNDILLGATASSKQKRDGRPVISELTGLVKHSSAAKIKMKLGDRLFNRFYRFAVVRNPHDRAYSLYSYCVQRLKNNPDFQAHLAGMDVHSADWAEISAEFWKRAGIHPDDAQSVVAKKNYPEEISFMESGIFRWNANRAVLTSPDFDACVQNEFFQRDAGFRPQANMLYDQKTGELLVPNLVKMEELRDNWPKLRKRLGVDAELPHENVSGTKENAPIAPSTMAFLREWFAQDYELLGY